MNLAFCQQCQPASLIGVNVGNGSASHAVNGVVHRAKVIQVPDTVADLQTGSETVGAYMDRLSKKYRGQLEARVVTVKSYDCPAFELIGGLGDVLHCLHTTDRYTGLMDLGPKDRRLVVLMSHNPHAQELFEWHPKRGQFDVLYLGYRAPWGPEQRKANGIPEPMLSHSRWPVTPLDYYPGPADRAPLEDLGRRKYIAFCLTGSNNNNRDIPTGIADLAANVAIKMGYEVVVLGRTYRTNAMHGNATVAWNHVEPQLKPRKGLISMVDKLSVPGTLRAIAMADGVFCAHSALCLASWWVRRPVYVLYEHGYGQNLFAHSAGYTFGRDFPETRHGLYTDWTEARFREWMTYVKAGKFPAKTGGAK